MHVLIFITTVNYRQKNVHFIGGSQRHAKLEKALVNMMIFNHYRLLKITDEGFEKFVSILDPRFQLPSRRTLTRTLLPAVYDNSVKSLKT